MPSGFMLSPVYCGTGLRSSLISRNTTHEFKVFEIANNLLGECCSTLFERLDTFRFGLLKLGLYGFHISLEGGLRTSQVFGVDRLAFRYARYDFLSKVVC
jgi:hypothetical protein